MNGCGSCCMCALLVLWYFITWIIILSVNGTNLKVSRSSARNVCEPSFLIPEIGGEPDSWN